MCVRVLGVYIYVCGWIEDDLYKKKKKKKKKRKKKVKER